jgi:hypothetical protein
MEVGIRLAVYRSVGYSAMENPVFLALRPKAFVDLKACADAILWAFWFSAGSATPYGVEMIFLVFYPGVSLALDPRLISSNAPGCSFQEPRSRSARQLLLGLRALHCDIILLAVAHFCPKTYADTVL